MDSGWMERLDGVAAALPSLVSSLPKAALAPCLAPRFLASRFTRAAWALGYAACMSAWRRGADSRAANHPSEGKSLISVTAQGGLGLGSQANYAPVMLQLCPGAPVMLMHLLMPGFMNTASSKARPTISLIPGRN
jgi:hypothetical protein